MIRLSGFAHRCSMRRLFCLALATVLLFCDTCFILYSIQTIGLSEYVPTPFHVAIDNGWAEHFQYIKELGIALLFLSLALVQGLHYMPYSILFAYILFDDVFRFHERFGEIFLRKQILFESSALVKYYGELIINIGIGIPSLIVLLCTLKHVEVVHRSMMSSINGLILLFGFFAVALDAFSLIANAQQTVYTSHSFLSVLEDGGEMITMSAILVMVVAYSITIACCRTSVESAHM